jgi:hypothetical protein
MRAERVAKERKALLTGISQRGLRLIERQPELCHHFFRPRQRLGRTTAAEDDEVVGVRDDMSLEHFATSASTPVLQESIYVDVGEQRTRDALNAKGNFQFERSIYGWKCGIGVVDMRRKK